ncbi:MAG TPA: hypothetical protein VNF91_10745 [Candidatus Acidoferrum sp.]|nr:hypothetical protein [Candidatus Acidoferrum sp.]
MDQSAATMTPAGAIYTYGLDSAAGLHGEALLSVLKRLNVDTVIDLRRPASGLAKGAVDPHAASSLYAGARSGRRILLVCSHPDPLKCHRHAEIALPIAQDAARYAAARAASSEALPIASILIRHVLPDGRLVDPVELEAERPGKRRRRT